MLKIDKKMPFCVTFSNDNQFKHETIKKTPDKEKTDVVINRY